MNHMEKNCVDILCNHEESRANRAKAWNEFVASREKIIPALDAAMLEGVPIPSELNDHYLARMWIVTEKKKGWEDVKWSEVCNFGKRWRSSSGGCENIASKLIGLSLVGKRQDPKLFSQALMAFDWRNLCSMIRQGIGVPRGFGLRQLLFYACACWPESAAVDAINHVVEEDSELPREALDFSGRDALWYTLYRGRHFDVEREPTASDVWRTVESVRGAQDKICSLLISLGCNPDREPEGLGLSWRNIVEARACLEQD